MKGVFKRSGKVKPSAFHDSRTPDGTLVPIEDLPKIRRPYGSKDAVIGPHGLVYAPSGVYAQGGSSPPSSAALGGPEQHPEGVFLNDAAMDIDSQDNDGLDDQALKKQRQWRKWSEETIPTLVQPFLGLLRTSSNLRNMDGVRSQDMCHGCNQGRILDVSCIFFERIEKLSLCTCKEPALQLLSRGLFPCAPQEPTLAVDLNVLDFARELFVNAAPNTTAWCETLEGFLSSRKFKLTTRNTLRTRFGNAMHWYATLINRTNLMVRNYLDLVRGSVLSINDEGDMVGEEATHHSQPIAEDTSMDDASAQVPPDRPSEYLRERCPLCFGGQNWKKADQLVDAIVCIDACFTQKRRKSQGNAWQAPNVHPETVFIPTEDLKEMEALVEEARPSKPTKSSKKGSKANQADAAATTTPDYEPNIKVPISVLDECNDSFTAADERRVKASTAFFADTGLMGLLCRHDRVLWLANMTSPGEKQFYALALLKQLFAHIPASMRIGVLYDIGCQIHRSCEKYGFLGDVLDRIIFGISVFHAYGHQWPCQLIYHPRKCEGFGLTDGEGCERFWNAIKPLIPSCRVSTHYNRIYTIDTKVKHIDQKSLFSLGTWLQRKYAATIHKKNESLVYLQDLFKEGYSEGFLREQWKLQITEQTKPLKKQSKTNADKAIEEILVITRNVAGYKKEMESLNSMLDSGEYGEDLTAEDIGGQIEDLDRKIKQGQQSIKSKREKLSVDGRLSLTRLLGNLFLQKRMNALALKQRIRDRLRNRKFEIESLERAYRSVINEVNQAKLQKHSDQHVKKKESSIQALARNYNKLCAEMTELIKGKKDVPRGAVAPVPINLATLFQLDVDDDIWLDIGLTDDNDTSAIPPWLGNEAVREGIKALLQYDRCVEEEHRLKAEKLSMYQWFKEEWQTITTAIETSAEDPDLVFRLQERKEFLLRLCIIWQPCIRVIPQEIEEDWGPNIYELKEARQYEFTESATKFEDLIDEGEWEQYDDEDLVSAEILDSVDFDIVQSEDY